MPMPTPPRTYTDVITRYPQLGAAWEQIGLAGPVGSACADPDGVRNHGGVGVSGSPGSIPSLREPKGFQRMRRIPADAAGKSA